MARYILRACPKDFLALLHARSRDLSHEEVLRSEDSAQDVPEGVSNIMNSEKLT